MAWSPGPPPRGEGDVGGDGDQGDNPGGNRKDGRDAGQDDADGNDAGCGGEQPAGGGGGGGGTGHFGPSFRRACAGGRVLGGWSAAPGLARRVTTGCVR